MPLALTTKETWRVCLVPLVLSSACFLRKMRPGITGKWCNGSPCEFVSIKIRMLSICCGPACPLSQPWMSTEFVTGGVVLTEKPAVNPWLIAVTVTLATFMELLDTSIANVALPYIGGGLGRSYDEVTWILKTYLVANAVILPMSAWLSRVFGRKTYYLGCVALFTLTSFFCGLAPTLGIMLSSRVLQGLAGGGLAPVSQAILVDTFPPQAGIGFRSLHH